MSQGYNQQPQAPPANDPYAAMSQGYGQPAAPPAPASDPYAAMSQSYGAPPAPAAADPYAAMSQSYAAPPAPAPAAPAPAPANPYGGMGQAPAAEPADPNANPLGGKSLEWQGNDNDPSAKTVRLRDRLQEADIERRKAEEEAIARERAAEIRREERMKKINYMNEMPENQPAGTGEYLGDGYGYLIGSC